ncbi:MAG: phage portal protein family protein, partial [Bradyrhizobium sp.]
MATDANTKPFIGEIATSGGGRDITRGFVTPGPIQPTDRLLQAKGYDYQLYEQVLSDDQVKATLEQRRHAVVSKEWEVLPGGTSAQDKAAAEFLSEQLKRIRWDMVTSKMLFGVFYGYAVGECLWARDGANIVLDAVKVRRQRRFRFDNEGKLRLLTMSQPQGEILPERKFWTFATGGDNDDDPYGLGLAHWLYWPVLFKRNGLKFWLIFLDKLAMPTPKGEYGPGATPDEKRKLLEALVAITTDSAIIVPEGMKIELLEAARSATPDYVTLHDKMNAAISKVVV